MRSPTIIIRVMSLYSSPSEQDSHPPYSNLLVFTRSHASANPQDTCPLPLYSLLIYNARLRIITNARSIIYIDRERKREIHWSNKDIILRRYNLDALSLFLSCSGVFLHAVISMCIKKRVLGVGSKITYRTAPPPHLYLFLPPLPPARFILNLFPERLCARLHVSVLYSGYPYFSCLYTCILSLFFHTVHTMVFFLFAPERAHITPNDRSFFLKRAYLRVRVIPRLVWSFLSYLHGGIALLSWQTCWGNN